MDEMKWPDGTTKSRNNAFNWKMFAGDLVGSREWKEFIMNRSYMPKEPSRNFVINANSARASGRNVSGQKNS